MDAEERALLAAIIAHPEEDTPRLVYADWLQERDRPERAELIRAQINLARTKGAEGFERERHQWNQRVRSLLHAHSKRWRKELPQLSGVRWGQFERGMVDSASTAVWNWYSEVAENLARIFDHIPPRLLRITFYGLPERRPDDWGKFLQWDGVNRFVEIVASVWISAYSEPELARVCFTSVLTREWGEYPRTLDLRNCPATEESARDLLSVADRRLPVLVLSKVALGTVVQNELAARFGDRVRLV